MLNTSPFYWKKRIYFISKLQASNKMNTKYKKTHAQNDKKIPQSE